MNHKDSTLAPTLEAARQLALRHEVLPIAPERALNFQWIFSFTCLIISGFQSRFAIFYAKRMPDLTKFIFDRQLFSRRIVAPLINLPPQPRGLVIQPHNL
jgi:hypothetical protein